jgi:tetratricopeptide (TPR) repeat protein
MTKTRQYILIALIILLYAATLPLNTFFKNSFFERNKEPDVIQNIFGGMRSFVADWSFMKAEEYHHRGLPFMAAIAYHQGESTLMAEGHAVKEEHHNAGEENKKDLFSIIYRSVKITGDSHLVPAEEKEVLPWFYVEAMFNPNDIRGYTLGGYWLERIGRFKESLKFLKEGEKNNPDSAQILTSIAKLYYRDNRYEDAVSYLEKARILWLMAGPPNEITNQYIESDRLITFDLLGYLYEREGQYNKAIEIYSESLKFLDAPIIRERIIKLKNMVESVK